MKVCMTAGGSGGHIFPAIALADACTAASMDVFFIGNKGKMEATEIPKAGFAFFMIESKELSRSVLSNVRSVFQQVSAVFKAYHILKQQQPDLVIGFGGYVTVPVVLAAKLRGIRVLLHEQNAIVGKANRFLSRFADGIAVCYPATVKELNHKNVRLIGNPRATVAINKVTEDHLISKLGLDERKKTALIVMGSLGSVSVNEILKKFIVKASVSNHQYIIATGRRHYTEFIRDLQIPKNVLVVDFADQVSLLSQIELLIVRGGATTAAEMLAKGVASIIVPSPYVPNNHQLHNAMALASQGASVCIEEKDLDEEKLFETAEKILNDDQLRLNMALAAKSLGIPDALDRMVGWVHEFYR